MAIRRPPRKAPANQVRSFVSRDRWLKEQSKKAPGELDAGLRKGQIAEIKQEGDDASRSLSFTISTAAPDRDRDTIDVAGWQLENFVKNPVVLWAHNPWDPPIAKATETTADEERLKSIAEFAGPEVYPFADTIYQLLKGGFLSATSVGFWPLEWTFNEERGGVDFKVQELWEWSVVPIPSNPEALIEARSAGIDLDPLREWGMKALDGWSQEKGLYVPRSELQRTIQILGNPKSVFDFGTAYELAEKRFAEGVPFSEVLDEISKSQEPVPVSGIWLRTVSDGVQVLAEVDNKWLLVIEEVAAVEDVTISHIVEPLGIRDAPIDNLKGEIAEALKALTIKRGRVLSKKNEELIVKAVDNLQTVLKALDKEDDDEEEDNAPAPVTAAGDDVVFEIDDQGDAGTTETGLTIDGLNLEAADLKALISEAVKSGVNGATGRVD